MARKKTEPAEGDVLQQSDAGSTAPAPAALTSIYKAPVEDSSDDVAYVRRVCEQARTQAASMSQIKVIIKQSALEPVVREMLPTALIVVDEWIGPPVIWRRMML